MYCRVCQPKSADAERFMVVKLSDWYVLNDNNKLRNSVYHDLCKISLELSLCSWKYNA